MSQTMSLQFHPQPPSHPKTTGGKRGPSAPISIPSLASNDEDSDHSITDHSPPVQNRVSAFELPVNGNKQNSLILLTTKSPRGHTSSKKFGPSASSPRILNNNLVAFNLNHGSLSNAAHTSVPTSFIIFNNNINSNTVISFNPASCVINNNSQTENNIKNSQILAANLNLTHAATNSQSNTHNVSASSADAVDTLITSNNDAHSLTQISDSNISPSAKTVDHINPGDGSCSPSATFAYEHDHDYDNIASPSSSTSSGPIYVRPPGFKHHAQEIVAPSIKNSLKKKKSYATLGSLRDGFKKREATPPKLKPKREPLPMKLRALPQSFWQQPNVAHQVSPSTLFPVLPPLPSRDTDEALMDVRPVTPPDDRESVKKSQQMPERKITAANTDLLFKLFEGVGDEKPKTQVVSRNRAQQKTRKLVTKSNTKGLFLGNDPYMVDAVTEKIFPQLTLEGTRYSGGGNASLQLITFKEGDKTVTLPSLNNDQNYTQMLSELVMHI